MKIRTSTHILGRRFMHEPEAPLRAFMIGHILIMWDGKPGDYRETVDTAEFFEEEPRNE